MEQELNNYYSYIHASVLDSVTPTADIVCSNNLPCPNVGNRFSNPRTKLISPESRTLESLGVLDLGDLFFHYRSMSN